MGDSELFGACFSPRFATGSTAWFRFHVGIGLFLSVHSYIQKGRGVHRSRTQWGPVTSLLGQRRTDPEADHYVNIMPVGRRILTVKRCVRFIMCLGAAIALPLYTDIVLAMPV